MRKKQVNVIKKQAPKGGIKCYFKNVGTVFFFKDAMASVKMDNKTLLTKKNV